MRNRNLLVLTMLVLLATFFFSCSKESPVTENQTTSTAIQNNSDGTNSGGRLAPQHYGSIKGILMPVPAKASIIAFNSQYISGEATCQQDGSFELNNLVPGGYTIQIDYVPIGGSNYFSLAIPKVVIIAGSVTNLGIVVLD